MKQKRASRKKARRTGAAAVSAKQQGTQARAAGKENREHKSSVFTDLFYEDETAEKNLLSLYNALHGTNYQGEKKIHKIRVGDVLYKNFKNDISFEMDYKVIVFGEHQATINKNMPLRLLLYVGRAYEQLIETKARYRRHRVRIPTPEFYTFYNGIEDFPLEKELHLSDSFLSPTAATPLELTVKVININSNKGHDILKNAGYSGNTACSLTPCASMKRRGTP